MMDNLTADGHYRFEPGFDVGVLFAPSFSNRSADATDAMLMVGMSSDVDGYQTIEGSVTNAYITEMLVAMRGTHSGT